MCVRVLATRVILLSHHFFYNFSFFSRHWFRSYQLVPYFVFRIPIKSIIQKLDTTGCFQPDMQRESWNILAKLSRQTTYALECLTKLLKLSIVKY